MGMQSALIHAAEDLAPGMTDVVQAGTLDPLVNALCLATVRERALAAARGRASPPGDPKA